MENCLAIIVAAGRGSRMSDGNASTGAPKQYRRIGNSNVLELAVNTFLQHSEVTNVMVVIHADDRELYDNCVIDHPKLLAPVIGGSTRQDSIFNGLSAAKIIQNWEKVLIHDAARVFVGSDIIGNVIQQIKPNQGALPAAAVSDTLKKVDADSYVTNTVARDRLFAAQTPQGFLFEEIYQCHWQAQRDNIRKFTDDASIFEAAGKSIKIIPSSATNFKITTQDDLVRAREIIVMRSQQNDGENGVQHADIRVGNGYDVHAFAPGNEVILGGIAIPFDQKLSGHSDADVVLHALTDALLGTIGQGDIGSHFPPIDSKWKGADSKQFLDAALELIRKNGGIITNLDVTIVCEAPKIGPHRDKIRENISEIAGMELNRVSIKATTSEKMGFLGRGEGIAALANATVSFGTLY